ncbi:hypothetical protein HDU85_001383 [Gaertneriomyces sp. JEL0708]|nr:hypothetical protein HDU85_001383 [Gaertneriomyces sp. JEL0708]
MGAKSSKNEPIVIYNEPDVAIQFSPALLKKLEGPPSNVREFPQFGSLPIPPSVGYTQAGNLPQDVTTEDVEEIVRQRVNREMELHQQKRVVYEQRSADHVRRETEDLLRRQKAPPKPAVSDACIAAEEALITCYKSNPKRTLDCWKEVENLKAEAKRAQRDFINSH